MPTNIKADLFAQYTMWKNRQKQEHAKWGPKKKKTNPTLLHRTVSVVKDSTDRFTPLNLTWMLTYI